MTTAAQVLSQFQATGVQTCFHDRHVNPQIYAGLDGSNWSIKDYEARGGYQALRKLLGRDGGVQARWDNLVGVAELWARIDATPMRRRQLRDAAASQTTRLL